MSKIRYFYWSYFYFPQNSKFVFTLKWVYYRNQYIFFFTFSTPKAAEFLLILTRASPSVISEDNTYFSILDGARFLAVKRNFECEKENGEFFVLNVYNSYKCYQMGNAEDRYNKQLEKTLTMTYCLNVSLMVQSERLQFFPLLNPFYW